MGTASVGAAFRPIILIWFVILAALGLVSILSTPDVLLAVDPTYAVSFPIANRRDGFLILGAVFLVVPGGEALYADKGGVVLPGMLGTWRAAVGHARSRLTGSSGRSSMTSPRCVISRHVPLTNV